MKKDYLQLTAKFKKFKILVIGDFIVDAYFNGSCTRLSPEAPVPVVDIVEKHYCLGGASNVAANLRALGADIFFCTVTGSDEQAVKGKLLLGKAGIRTELMVADPGRTTLTKTRIVTPLQPLLRFDEGSTTAINGVAESKLLNHIRTAYAVCDAVIVADYAKGVVGRAVVETLMQLKQQHKKMIVVDSKRIADYKDLKPTMVKPNYEESIQLLGLPFQNAHRKEQLKNFGKQLQEVCQSAITAVTLDCEGSMIFHGTNLVCASAAPPVVNPHVSGAGDTYISTCLLALLSGANLQQMADMATAAALVSIEKEHTALCSIGELNAALTPVQKFITTSAQLKKAIQEYRRQGKHIVFTNGCFDILHSGHVSYLRQAKQMGDILIVGLNRDESIRRLKGEQRPINSLANRVAVLSALACVDHIVAFGAVQDDTPIALIKQVHPDVFVKGGDYAQRRLPDQDILDKLGCKISLVPYIEKQSTTQVISQMDSATRHKFSQLN